ncbi:hypothetical protein D3C71_1189160 [compost metagenome]
MTQFNGRSGRATMRTSLIGPVRSAASKPSSTRSTSRSLSTSSNCSCGCAAINCPASGTSTLRPNIEGAVSFNTPEGVEGRSPSRRSASSSPLSSGAQCSTNWRPSGVRLTLRVLRWSSRTPKALSSRLIARDSPDWLIPSWPAATVKLRASATCTSMRTALRSMDFSDSCGYA